MQELINGALFKKMIIEGAEQVDLNKEHINELNVFPVPDGDTGTNMSLTLKSVVDEINLCTTNDMPNICEAVIKGALKGARGNSGVILSQILKGICEVLKGYNEINTKNFAYALQQGASIAYKIVTKPKEGTILTVIKAMAKRTLSVSKKHSDFETCLKAMLKKGEKVLKLTPEMLPILKKAGVVDAGGRGLVIFFVGLYNIISNNDLVLNLNNDKIKNTNETADHIINYEDLSKIQFAYCTEFFVINLNKNIRKSNISILRKKLMEIGDSVICVGDLKLIKVHLHTNKPNKALNYALNLGEISGVKIENMLEQNRMIKEKAEFVSEQKPFGLLAIAMGDGLIDIFKDLGVDNVLSGGQTMNPSALDIANAVNEINATKVFIFPNNKNIILAAQQAQSLTDKSINVVPTKTIPEGISAVLCFNSESTVAENLQGMDDAIEKVCSGAVTYAVRTTAVNKFKLNEGDIIGLDDKAIIAKGHTVNKTTEDLISKMLNEKIINVTLFYGENVIEEDAKSLQELLTKKYPKVEFNALYGGQPVYYYIISFS
ncbi:MAG: DAK2 domain-containing protein [Clostridia bacterium]|nr:DAK2 domain-containing protein [Clostridia bacterium]MDD4275824.1 DAK2 domain-containing protein [Clostridia bacterium]